MTAVVETLNPDGRGRVVVICEHASYYIPSEYNGLGLSEQDRKSHAAWDLGARDVSLLLSAALDAPIISSTVSRLVYDCNRPPKAASAMPEKSERIDVPGNIGLSRTERDARTQAIYNPFCAAVSKVLDVRGPDTIIVTMHSFTPTYHGKSRLVELGLLCDSDSRLVDAMLSHADMLPHRRIERNAPYGPKDGVTHSLKIHAQSRDLLNVMVEVRNDLLTTEKGIATMAQELLTLLRAALQNDIKLEDAI